jgi:hypothetical protein
MKIYAEIRNFITSHGKGGVSSEQKQLFTRKLLPFMNNQIFCLCWKRGFRKRDKSFEILTALNTIKCFL